MNIDWKVRDDTTDRINLYCLNARYQRKCWNKNTRDIKINESVSDIIYHNAPVLCVVMFEYALPDKWLTCGSW